MRYVGTESCNRSVPDEMNHIGEQFYAKQIDKMFIFVLITYKIIIFNVFFRTIGD